MENNNAHNNTAGLLAFITPGLPIKTTFDVIFRDNFIVDNNHKNFGPPGSLVSGIPTETVILIMSVDDVIIENNIISSNHNAGTVIVDLANRADASKNGNKPKGGLKALMMVQFSKKGPDILQ